MLDISHQPFETKVIREVAVVDIVGNAFFCQQVEDGFSARQSAGGPDPFLLGIVEEGKGVERDVVELKIAGQAAAFLNIPAYAPADTPPLEQGIGQETQVTDPLVRAPLGIVVERGPQPVFRRRPAGNDRWVAGGGITENRVERPAVLCEILQKFRVALLHFPAERIDKQEQTEFFPFGMHQENLCCRR